VGESWSREEDVAIVANYLDMLELELRGQPVNKAAHNRALLPLLRGRTRTSVEFKHANISAALIQIGFPFIDGYKPRSNFQRLLSSEIAAQLEARPELVVLAKQVVSAVASAPSIAEDLSTVFVPAPRPDRKAKKVYERPAEFHAPLFGVNYLEREAQNASLGTAGELFVLELEHKRLWASGAKQLAKRIEHVASTRGDGLGFDIASFDVDGRERLIEVKTTGFGAMTPFFASKREVGISEEREDCFHLYRVFNFRKSPKVFVLDGALSLTCRLDPVSYRLSLR
jgi:hypothetical protein